VKSPGSIAVLAQDDFTRMAAQVIFSRPEEMFILQEALNRENEEQKKMRKERKDAD